MAYTEDDERPESTYGSGNDPDLGCIDCEGNDYNHYSKPNAIVSCWGAIGDLDWIDSGNNIPAIMFHGDLDPIVPFDSGYPFTIDIALPIVYGSNLIHDKLNLHEIENELYVGEGELHEYWGAVNGNWFGGPNDNYTEIIDNAYQFLYNQLDVFLGDVNQDNMINILDVVQIINLILLNDFNTFADLNSDNVIDILDVVLLVNLILNVDE